MSDYILLNPTQHAAFIRIHDHYVKWQINLFSPAGLRMLFPNIHL